MTSQELVMNSILFKSPERLAYDFPENYGSDFVFVNMSPSPDDRPKNGIDEWGAVWKNIGNMNLGEVQEFPLKEWSQLSNLKIPDISDDKRWKSLENIREQAGEKFILASGVSIYERVHFIRGLENTWMDIYENPEKLGEIIDILVEMNLYAIKRYAELGADGYIFPDDWGLQNKLMISPEKWRQIWKPRYERIYRAAHDAGLLTFFT